MKKIALILLLIMSLYSVVGCSNGEKKSESSEKVKPVKVIELKENETQITLDYIGSVETETAKKYSFKTAGKIDKVFVTEGQKINKGDKLAQLAIKDLSYAVKAAKAQLDGAQAQYNNAIKGASDEEIKKAELNVKKAEDSYNFTKNTYGKLELIYQNGDISKQELDKAKLEMDARESDLSIAKQIELQAKKGINEENKKVLLSQIEQARINYEQRNSMLEDSIITSDLDGYIMEVLYKEGEIVNTGYPVIITRNDYSVVNIGLSQEDIDKVQLGTKAVVRANEREITGKVVSIGIIPDRQTRTYNVEIELAEDVFRIGTITKVSLIIDEIKGIWIPISSIMSNGEDYVFIIEDNLTKKKKVTLGEIKGFNILVEGLSSGDSLVVEGFKEVIDGEKVLVRP